jgi:hypothetical protein
MKKASKNDYVTSGGERATLSHRVLRKSKVHRYNVLGPAMGTVAPSLASGINRQMIYEEFHRNVEEVNRANALSYRDKYHLHGLDDDDIDVLASGRVPEILEDHNITRYQVWPGLDRALLRSGRGKTTCMIDVLCFEDAIPPVPKLSETRTSTQEADFFEEEDDDVLMFKDGQYVPAPATTTSMTQQASSPPFKSAISLSPVPTLGREGNSYDAVENPIRRNGARNGESFADIYQFFADTCDGFADTYPGSYSPNPDGTRRWYG